MVRRNLDPARPSALDGFFLNDLVEAAAAESLQIDADVVESNLFESLHDGIPGRLVEQAVDFLLRNFDSCEVPVKTHAKLAEVKRLHEDFTAADFV